MADLIGKNAFFATMYFTYIPVNHNGEGEYRQENRDLAKYISKLFDKSTSVVVDNRGVERTILQEFIQPHNDLESTIIPKVYTCGNRVVIVVDEELKSQKALYEYKPIELIELMKSSSEKRRALSDSIYNILLGAGCTKGTQHTEYFCDINAFEVQSEKDPIIDEMMAGGNVNMHRNSETEGIEDACSILSSTGTDHIENILTIYRNGVKIPLRCSTMKTNPDNRTITMLTTSRGASSAREWFEKEYIVQTE